MKFKEFLSSEFNTNKDMNYVNEDFIKGKDDLHEYIVKAFKIFECKHIKMLDWCLIRDESKFETDKVNVRYIKSNKNKKFDKRLPMSDSRYNMLQIRFQIDTKDAHYIKTLNLLLFKKIDKYYYLIDGNRYSPMYQIVDSSVYNRKDYIHFRSHLGPSIIKRLKAIITDVDGNCYKVPNYLLCIFKKKINFLLFYLAILGVDNTLRYMQMDRIIRINKKEEAYGDEYTFKTTNGMYIHSISYFFDNDPFVKGCVYSFLELLEECETLQEFYDPKHVFWTIKVGNLLTKEEQEEFKRFNKGKGFLLSFSSLLDPLTKDALNLNIKNKQHILSIIRWMVRNFPELKARDNMSIFNKRVRKSEYIASYVLQANAKKNRKFIMNMTTQDIKAKDVEELLNMAPDYCIRSILSKSNLIKYDNAVNDTDIFTALKWSIKGPGSMGEKSSNSVSVNARDVDPRAMGILDLNTTGNSDPSMTGVFVPFVKVYKNGYFKDGNEPECWDENFKNLCRNYFDGEELPVKDFDYFYGLEKRYAKKIKRLHDINHFIKNDPYINRELIYFNCEKEKSNKKFMKLERVHKHKDTKEKHKRILKLKRV